MVEPEGAGKEGAGLPVEDTSIYEGFVQEVTTRRWQARRGAPVGRHASVWVSKPEAGSDAEVVVEALGDADVVQEIGDALEGGYEYRGWSPQPMPEDREAEVVGGALENLLESAAREAPHVLPRPLAALDRLRRAAGLPELPGGGQLVEGEDRFLRAVEEANAAVEPFQSGEKGTDDGQYQ